jgi:hypothetical protein
MQRKQAMDLDQQLHHLWQHFQHWWVTPAGGSVDTPEVPCVAPPFLNGFVLASPEMERGVALIRAIDAGGVPLNPMRVNDIGRKLGLVVPSSAPMDETIERIRQQLLAMVQPPAERHAPSEAPADAHLAAEAPAPSQEPASV